MRNPPRPAPSLSQSVPVAVYGTLRIGSYNHDWAQKGVIKEVEGVTIPGALYFVQGRSGYPVAKLDEPGTIHGDLLYFDHRSDTYIQTYRMERGAGYELREVDVTLPDGIVVKGYAWHYCFHPRGQRIRSGDWLKSQTRG